MKSHARLMHLWLAKIISASRELTCRQLTPDIHSYIQALVFSLSSSGIPTGRHRRASPGRRSPSSIRAASCIAISSYPAGRSQLSPAVNLPRKIRQENWINSSFLQEDIATGFTLGRGRLQKGIEQVILLGRWVLANHRKAWEPFRDVFPQLRVESVINKVFLTTDP